MVRVKLTPTPAQAASLTATLARCNAAAGYVAQVAHSRRTTHGRTLDKMHLQKLVYADVKSMGLSAQPTILVVHKVAGAYAALRANINNGNLGPRGSKRRVDAESRPIEFRPGAAQPFDDRCLSWDHTAQTISIWTTDGRLKDVRFTGRPCDLLQLAARRQGQSDLICTDGIWYLMATVDLPDVPVDRPVGWVGVDLGIVNIATTATDNAGAGTTWSGGQIADRRRKNVLLRAKLQAKGTRSAKRLLKKRNKKEARFVGDVNHQVSKQIVAEAKRTARGIAIENLSGIRARVRLRKPQRATIHSWAFAQLGTYLTYKAAAAGVALVQVNPAYTSQTCSGCGYVSRKNRPTQAIFACQACGVLLHADHNAAVNIARRGDDGWGAINRPRAHLPVSHAA